MTIQDWIDASKTESTGDNQQRIKAIETLMEWPLFKKEWDWTGLDTLKYAIISGERAKAKSKYVLMDHERIRGLLREAEMEAGAMMDSCKTKEVMEWVIYGFPALTAMSDDDLCEALGRTFGLQDEVWSDVEAARKAGYEYLKQDIAESPLQDWEESWFKEVKIR